MNLTKRRAVELFNALSSLDGLRDEKGKLFLVFKYSPEASLTIARNWRRLQPIAIDFDQDQLVLLASFGVENEQTAPKTVLNDLSKAVNKIAAEEVEVELVRLTKESLNLETNTIPSTTLGALMPELLA
jgi:hypothetical protein